MKNWNKERHRVQPVEGEAFDIEVAGRERWALEELIKAISAGITSRDYPGVRLAASIHELRNKGVPIETLHVKHGGAFRGTHGRYVLRARVTRVEEVD